MFISFRLNDAETRYTNPERECYAVVRYLTKVTWMVQGSRYPVMLYTDHVLPERRKVQKIPRTGTYIEGTLYFVSSLALGGRVKRGLYSL